LVRPHIQRCLCRCWAGVLTHSRSGGCVALSFASEFPDVAQNLCVISCTGMCITLEAHSLIAHLHPREIYSWKCGFPPRSETGHTSRPQLLVCSPCPTRCPGASQLMCTSLFGKVVAITAEKGFIHLMAWLWQGSWVPPSHAFVLCAVSYLSICQG